MVKCKQKVKHEVSVISLTSCLKKLEPDVIAEKLFSMFELELQIA